MQSELLTILEFCKLTSIGRTKVYQLINAGSLKAVKVGKRTLIPKNSMNAWIKALEEYPVH